VNPKKANCQRYSLLHWLALTKCENFPDYDAWLDYICEEDSKENRQAHAHYVLQAMQWISISDLTADEVLTYLSENFEI